jgi:hypothetical protein
MGSIALQLDANSLLKKNRGKLVKWSGLGSPKSPKHDDNQLKIGGWRGCGDAPHNTGCFHGNTASEMEGGSNRRRTEPGSIQWHWRAEASGGAGTVGLGSPGGGGAVWSAGEVGDGWRRSSVEWHGEAWPTAAAQKEPRGRRRFGSAWLPAKCGGLGRLEMDAWVTSFSKGIRYKYVH